MLGLRRLRQAFYAVADVVRVWVRDTFRREAFIALKFDQFKETMLENLNKLLDNEMHADRIQVLGMMPTASMHMLRTGGDEHDANVTFCLLNMSEEEYEQCFAGSLKGFWNGAGLSAVLSFRVITSLDFQDRVDAFAESEYAHGLSHDVVEFIAHEYAHLERLSSPYITALWSNPGCRIHWLRDRLNAQRASRFSLTDAIDIFDILRVEMAEEANEPQDS